MSDPSNPTKAVIVEPAVTAPTNSNPSPPVSTPGMSPIIKGVIVLLLVALLFWLIYKIYQEYRTPTTNVNQPNTTTQTKSSGAPSTNPVALNLPTVGCYQDVNKALSDRLMKHLGVKGYYSCAKDAKAQGYAYFAMQAGQGKVSSVGDCFGTNDLARAQSMGPATTCSSSVDIFGHPMGGERTNYIYQTSNNGVVPEYEDAFYAKVQHLGCYRDTTKAALKGMGSNRGVDNCAAVAAEFGYRYFAVQESAGGCYVSNDLNQITAGGAVPDACTFRKSGTRPFGGPQALSVYGFK